MKHQPQDLSARKRPFRRWLLRGAAALLLLVVAGVGAAAWFARDLAEDLLRLALSQAGLPPRTLTVTAIGFERLTLGPVQFAGGGPKASAIEAEWSLASLMQRRLTRVRVVGLRLALPYRDGGLAVAGLPRTGGGGAAPVFPVERLELAGAEVSFKTANGKGKATFSGTAQVDGEAALAADGALAGHARLAIVATPAGQQTIRAEANLPDWRLTFTGQPLAVMFSGASIVLPDWKVTAGRVDAKLQLAGDTAALTLTGDLRDDTAPARWPPLSVSVKARRGEQVLSFEGRATSRDRVLAVDFQGSHDLATGRGSARLDAAPLRFAPGGRQPTDLSPLLANPLRRLGGTIDAGGTLSWGRGATVATASMALAGVEFEAGPARISDLNGRLALDSVRPPHTARSQSITAKLQVASLPPGPLALHFSLPGGNRLRLDSGTYGLAGGSLSLANVLVQPGKPLEAAIGVRAVDLGALLTFVGVEGLSGSGILDGRIPVRLDPAGVTIADGNLAARGAGILRYTGAALPAGAAGAGEDTLKLLRDALADFHYTSLTLALNRAASGEGSLLVALKGANPAVLEGYPFNININFQANFDRLAGLLLGSYGAAEDLLRRSAPGTGAR